jgi:hypothetical protein
MKIKTAIIVTAIISLLVGIGFIISHDNKQADAYQTYIQQAPERNKEQLLKPEVIGITDDGQEVKRAIIEYVKPRQCESCELYSEKHYIYFVGKVKTDNAIVPSGKSTRIEPRVTISE